MLELQQLPEPALVRIVRHALREPRLTSAFLASFGSRFSTATKIAAARHLVLPDDDQLLLDAEDGPESLLGAVYRSPELAGHVQRLTVVPLDGHERIAETSQFALEGVPHPSTRIPALDDLAFFGLVAKLPALRTFEWYAGRLPPKMLCSALGHAAKGLTSFKLEITSDQDTRWAADDISSLPFTLVQLSLSQLSLEGAKNLGRALESSAFPGLERLALSRSPFVDDALLATVRDAKLSHLRISEMSGTKLSDKGIASVFASGHLRELALDRVEARFTKSCWKFATEDPPELTSIRVSFAEEGPHHSWISDHLLNIAQLVAFSPLTSISITRLVVSPADQSAAIPDVLAPRPVPRELFDAILEKGAALSLLELDFFEITLAELKTLLETCTGLVSLRIYLCAPFKSMLTLASAFALTIHLRSVSVIVDPRHMTQLAMTIPFSHDSSVSPTCSTSPSSRRSSGGMSSDNDMLPLTKEWRRFLKKNQLERVTWGGRGGVGTWTVSRTGINLRVEFEPVGTVTDGYDERGVDLIARGRGRRASEASNGAGEGVPARAARRASSVSLADSTLSGFTFSSREDEDSLPSFDGESPRMSLHRRSSSIVSIPESAAAKDARTFPKLCGSNRTSPVLPSSTSPKIKSSARGAVDKSVIPTPPATVKNGKNKKGTGGASTKETVVGLQIPRARK